MIPILVKGDDVRSGPEQMPRPVMGSYRRHRSQWVKTAKDMYNRPRIIFLTIIFLHFAIGNLLLAYNIIHRFTFQTVGNATFSVDSFFFLRWVL